MSAELEPDSDDGATVGMQGGDLVVVEVQDHDAVAAPDHAPVAELLRPGGPSHLDPQDRSNFRRRAVEPMQEPIDGVVHADRPAIPRHRSTAHHPRGGP